MKKSDVPFYNDPDDFDVSIQNTFPCDTQYMTYNPLMHRYYLTEEGLSHYNIDFNRKYVTDSPNKAQELIEKTSKKVYDYIQYKAGRTCYQIMMYRIAASPISIYPDRYYTRKQFEEALADQSRYLVESGDSARYSRANIDSETGEQMPIKPEDALRDTSDLSPETIRTLETLGLTRWFKVPQFVRLDPTKY
jgi:hypothetical protein